MKNETCKQPRVLRAVIIMLLFLIVTAALVAANFLVYSGQNPYTSLSERLKPSFYYRTVLIILISSLLYTPFSYGISNYFSQGARRNPKFSDIFFMFCRPLLFAKAVSLRLLILVIRGLYQLVALLLGVLAEGVLYIATLIWQKQNVLNMSIRELLQQIENTIVRQHFLYFSIFIWCIILLAFLLFYVRFMFCKYALLRFEELSILEAFRIGLFATRGRLFSILRYYLTYISYYVLLFATFGLLYVFLKPYREENFSIYAMRLVEQARGDYFTWRNLKKS